MKNDIGDEFIMNEQTILQGFSEWVANNWGASAILGGITWDIVKEKLLIPFKKKVGSYFIDEAQVLQCLEKIHNEQCKNIKKPFRDIEDTYEIVTGQSMPNDFIEKMKELIIENSEIIKSLNSDVKCGINAGIQHASRDVNNVNGTQIIVNN